MLKALKILGFITILAGLYLVVTGGQVSGLLFGLLLVFNGIDSITSAKLLQKLRVYEEEFGEFFDE